MIGIGFSFILRGEIFGVFKFKYILEEEKDLGVIDKFGRVIR